MTGDWIKMRTDLYRDPKVVLIAEQLFSDGGDLCRYVNQFCQRDMSVTRNVMRNAVVGALVSVWGVARHQGRRTGDDLSLDNCDIWVLDDIADMPGFGHAMMSVGWCLSDSGSLVFPKFFAGNNADPRESQAEKNRERQRRHRDRHRNVTDNVTHNADVTPREEKRRDNSSGGSREKRRDISTTEMNVVADAWNMLGAPFKAVRAVDEKRRKHLTARLADDDWRANWQAAMQRMATSKFCRGGSERGWVADFDWFIRPRSVNSILEGKYDDRSSTSVGGDRPAHRPTSAEARERGNVEAIAGFLRRAELRKGNAGVDGDEAHGGLHGAAIDSVARRVERVQADDNQPGGADDLRE